MKVNRKDLIMSKQTKKGTLFITEDGGFKMYFKLDLI